MIGSESGPNKQAIKHKINDVQKMVEKVRKKRLNTTFNPFGKAVNTLQGKTIKLGIHPAKNVLFTLNKSVKTRSIIIGAKINNNSFAPARFKIEYSKKIIKTNIGTLISVLKTA